MTAYRFANQEKKKQVSRTRIIGWAAFSVALIAIIVFVVAPLARSLFRGPAWLAQSADSAVANTVAHLSPKSALIAENNSLKDQVAQLSADQYQLTELQSENAALRSELSYAPTPASFVTGQVIGKPNQSLFNSMVLDIGSDQGVAVGQLVVSQGNLGVGTIASVSATTATVQLFGDPNFSGNLELSSKGITVPATGKGSGNFEIDIPREVAVADGDLLAYPEHPNVIVGVVKSIIFDSRDPFQTVITRLPVNVQELKFVEVIK